MPIVRHNPRLTANAQTLRKQQTPEERKLWYGFLRRHRVKFTRQKVLGRYIADFYAPQLKLAVELDGSQHYEAEGLRKDAERTAFLNGCGIRVVRIANCDVNKNFGGVCAYLDKIVAEAERERNG
ncbi:MAG: DUF559 domain-containing protein [Clostridia bacterium]|nr:DUF559 domain-containing protein [Clostridia bacterium]